MRIKIAAIILAAMIILPVLPVAQAAGTATMQAYIGEQDFTITVQGQATSENITGQGSFSFNYDSATGQFSGSLQASGDCDCQSQFTVSGQGSYTFDNGSYTYSYSVSGEGYISNSSVTMMPVNAFLPAQVPFPTQTTTITDIIGSQSFMVSFNVTGQGSGYYNVTYSSDQGSFNSRLMVENGVYMLLGVPGDLVVGISGEYTSTTDYIANTSSGSLYLVVAFNSGDPVVDGQLATSLYMALSMSSGGMGGQAGFTFSFDVDYVNSTALYINITYQGYATLGPGMGQGMPGQLPGQMPGSPTTDMIPSFNETPIMPMMYYDSYLTVSYNFNVNIDNTTGTYSVQAGMNGQFIPGPSADQSPVEITSLQVSGNIGSQQVSFTMDMQGSGDPMVAFDIAKALALVIAEIVTPPSPDTTATLSFEAGGDLQFVLVQGNQRTVLGQSFTLTEQNATLIKKIYIEYPGTEIASYDEAEDTLTVRSQAKAVLSISTMMQAEEMIVEAKSVEIRAGVSTVLDTRVIVLDAGEAKAMIKLLPGVVINGTFEAVALTQQEAAQIATSYGYQAAGEGVEVKGVASGTVEIGVRADVGAAQAGQLAILEISADGTVKMITEYKVEGDMVYFNTSSFSTFVPVYSTGTQPQQTTTTTTQTPTETYMTETETTTTTTQETTTTETGQTTTTTTPVQEIQENTTTEEAGAEGVSTAALAVVILVILAGAAYFLLRK